MPTHLARKLTEARKQFAQDPKTFLILWRCSFKQNGVSLSMAQVTESWSAVVKYPPPCKSCNGSWKISACLKVRKRHVFIKSIMDNLSVQELSIWPRNPENCFMLLGPWPGSSLSHWYRWFLWSLNGYTSKIEERVGQGQAVSGNNLLSCFMGPLTGRGTHWEVLRRVLSLLHYRTQ